MPARHRSRHRALQVLYQCDLRGTAGEEAIRHFYDGLYTEEHDERPSPDDFMESLVRGTLAAREQIDARIARLSAHWRIERMSAVDRNILRMAIYEMRQPGSPAPVVIDEALRLARRFSGEDSVAFINGVLDAARRDLLSDTES